MGNCWGAPVNNLSINPSNANSRDSLKADVSQSPPPIRRASLDGGGSSGRTSSDSGGPQRVPGAGGGRGERERPKSIVPNLKAFTMDELRRATRNFRPDTMLGEGGFGKVFKGWVNEKTYAPSRVGVGIPIAVKKSSSDSSQGLLEWQTEVKFLGKFSHPNLVKLLGYCWEDRQFLLVYEYMQKGSLESHLFRKGGDPISWDLRLKIAMGAARGLAFLHNSEKSVIYRDFKAANILLDQEFNAKLSDFGLAKLGPTDGSSHVTTRIVGTFGYAAPEYIATGHLYIKSDVYGFGVVLLELLTGLQALDQNRPLGTRNLVDWTMPLLSKKTKVKKLVDPRLGNQYPTKAAILVAELILTCLKGDPKRRPSMQEVLDDLEKINLIKESPKEMKPRPVHREKPSPSRRHAHHPSPVSHHSGGSGGRDRTHR